MAEQRPVDAALAPVITAIRSFSEFAATIPFENFWNIVILGEIDYRQHSPVWYDLIGVLNKEERVRADKSFLASLGPSMGTPVFRFDIGLFSIVCLPDRWEILTKDRQQQKRIVDVACLVFKKLWEIPVTTVGFNSQVVLKTKFKNAQEILAEKMRRAGLGFPQLKGKPDSQFVFRNTGEASSTVINLIGSSLNASDVILSYNREFPIRPKFKEGYYDAAEWIVPNAQTSWAEADEVGNGVLHALNSAPEVKHASQ